MRAFRGAISERKRRSKFKSTIKIMKTIKSKITTKIRTGGAHDWGYAKSNVDPANVRGR